MSDSSVPKCDGELNTITSIKLKPGLEEFIAGLSGSETDEDVILLSSSDFDSQPKKEKKKKKTKKTKERDAFKTEDISDKVYDIKSNKDIKKNLDSDIHIAIYSKDKSGDPKSYVIFGSKTKTYRHEIKKLDARYNGRLKAEREVNGKTFVVEGFSGGPGWIIPAKKYKEAKKMIKRINSGKVEVVEDQYQYVKYSTVKPKVGQKVVINMEEGDLKCKVFKVETHNGFIDEVYVSFGNDEGTKLVIVNGKWEIHRFPEEHTVRFV